MGTKTSIRLARRRKTNHKLGKRMSGQPGRAWLWWDFMQEVMVNGGMELEYPPAAVNNRPQKSFFSPGNRLRWNKNYFEPHENSCWRFCFHKGDVQTIFTITLGTTLKKEGRTQQVWRKASLENFARWPDREAPDRREFVAKKTEKNGTIFAFPLPGFCVSTAYGSESQNQAPNHNIGRL